MHSKKHRQFRKLKLRSKSKSRRGRSLKGGSPQPYEYEGVSLVEGNDLIQLAVTRMDDGTYTFNPIGKNFANYCELAKYYYGNNSLACVRQTSKNEKNAILTFPSWVDLLGIALVLANRFPTTSTSPIEIAKDDDISTITMKAIVQIGKNPSDQLFLSTAIGCLNFANEPFHNISGLSKYDLDKILNYIKRMMFFCKYVVVPNMNLGLLTFDRIFNEPDRCVQHLVDSTKFNENLAKPSFELYKKHFFTRDNLSRQPSAAPAPASPSAAVPADLESRVATLEREVAALKARQ